MDSDVNKLYPSEEKGNEDPHNGGVVVEDKVIARRLDAQRILKRRERGLVLHFWYKTSKIKISELEHSYPDLFNAVRGLPWDFIHSWQDGVALSPKIYKGVKRNGPCYILTWLDENHVSLSENQLLIVQALQLHCSFITYDQLFQYLRNHNWGNLVIDRHFKAIDSFPQITREEEEKLALERADVEARKKAEEENKERLANLKKELGDIQFAIGHLERSIENFKKSQKWADVVHFSKKVEQLRARETHVKDALNSWYRDSRGISS